jgi:hypothetical protein
MSPTICVPHGASSCLITKQHNQQCKGVFTDFIEPGLQSYGRIDGEFGQFPAAKGGILALLASNACHSTQYVQLDEAEIR